MGKGAKATETVDEGDLGSGRTDYPVACEDGKGVRGELPSGGGEDLAGIIRLIIGQFFPDFNLWLDQIKDPRRDHPMKKYPLRYLVWMAMLMIVIQSGSRHQFDKDKNTAQFLAHLQLLAGIDSATLGVATAETVDDLLQKIDPDEFRKLMRLIVRRLIAQKRLESCRFGGKWWRLTVDGTRIHSSAERHCPHCLTKTDKKTGAVTYYHDALEFKLVSVTGLAISIDSEFLVNTDGATKQDCELKAFYRAASRIKKEWPGTKFLLIGDAIYANQKIRALCDQYGWAYMITLKGNQKQLKDEATRRMESAPVKYHYPETGVEQVLRSVEYLRGGKRPCHAVSCVETSVIKKGEVKITRYLWITNLNPSEYRLSTLVNKVGRQRWKIENQGFDIQKNHGYNLTHSYGRKGNAWQNYYLLIQIVHVIMQMAIATDAIHKQPFMKAKRVTKDKPPSLLTILGSQQNFFRQLKESFRCCYPAWRDVSELEAVQLRFLNTA